jgi:hypothetical protein
LNIFNFVIFLVGDGLTINCHHLMFVFEFKYYILETKTRSDVHQYLVIINFQGGTSCLNSM